VMRLFFAQSLHVCRQECSAARWLARDHALGAVRRLQVAMEIVDCDHAHDYLLRLVRRGTLGETAQRQHGEGADERHDEGGSRNG
jgi:hypothetical protein